MSDLRDQLFRKGRADSSEEELDDSLASEEERSQVLGDDEAIGYVAARESAEDDLMHGGSGVPSLRAVEEAARQGQTLTSEALEPAQLRKFFTGEIHEKRSEDLRKSIRTRTEED